MSAWVSKFGDKERQDTCDALMDQLEKEKERKKQLLQLAEAIEQVHYLVNSLVAQINNGEHPRLNIIVCGKPRTGKTRIARHIAACMFYKGILDENSVYILNASDLSSISANEIHEELRRTAEQALGGVLVIEGFQAFFVPRSNMDLAVDFMAALEEITDTFTENLCVVICGSEDEVDKLLKCSEGMRRRFPFSINLEKSSCELIGKDEGPFDDEKQMSNSEYIEEALQKKGINEEQIDNQNLSRATNNDIHEDPNLLKKELAELKDEYKQLVAEMKQILREQIAAEKRMNDSILDLIEDHLRNEIKKQCERAYERDGSITGKPNLANDVYSDATTKKTFMIKLSKEDFSKVSDNPCTFDGELKDEEKRREITDLAVLFIKTDNGSGTGFLITSDGYAITCDHVIRNKEKDAIEENIKARFRDPSRRGYIDSFHECRVVYTLKDVDMAVIKLEGDDFPYLKLADRDREIKSGEAFTLSGYPFGFDEDITDYVGTVANGRGVKDNARLLCYNINTEGKCGQSGSPLIAHSDGSVIGILTGSVTRGKEEINRMRPISFFWDEFFK